MHKHLHNKQQMGCQPTMLFIFDKCQNRKTSIIFHTTNHLHHSQLSQFDILGMLIVKMWDVVISRHILVKGLMSNGWAMHATTLNFIVNLNNPC